MAGFDLSRWQSIQNSEEWSFFCSAYKFIGMYCIVNNSETLMPEIVYLNENAASILRLNYADVENGIAYDKFMAWFMNHSTLSEVPGRLVYIFHTGSEQFLIKLQKNDTSYGSLCFVQNYSDQLFDLTSAPIFKGKDAMTGLQTREQFVKNVYTDCHEDESGCLAVIHINGIENLNHWYGYNHSDRGLIAAAKTLNHFASDHVYIGVKSLKEFLIYFSNKDAASVYQILLDLNRAITETVILDDFGEMITNGSHLLSASIGYYTYVQSEHTAESFDLRPMMDKASFALAQAREDPDKPICSYIEENYLKDKARYGDILDFLKLTNDNLFAYHFQPIVDVRNGSIYAYEMLMRTQEGIALSPEKILDIASRKNQLYDIEKVTMYNAFRIMHDHEEAFANSRLFVNSIPAHILKDEHFDDLKNQYSNLLDKIIIEFTEQTEVSDENLAIIQRRCRMFNMGLAIDDYGTGYSNVSSLLRYAPNYVKIDRSLLSGIQIDSKKQHLVSNIIQFAHKNGILVLAEGVETPMELAGVISLGADLIQGFYTAKPERSLPLEIDAAIKAEINLLYKEYEQSLNDGIFCLNHDTSISLADVDEKIYREILVDENELTIDGTGCKQSSLLLRTKPNCRSHITLKNVRLNSSDPLPAIIIGENSTLNLEIIDRNYISGNCGIMVPFNSKLKITGKGTLSISCDAASSYGIGNDFSHSYGNITIDLEGQLGLYINGENAVGIGGGYNTGTSFVNLKNSDIVIQTTGVNVIGIGCENDISNCRICNCHVDIASHANHTCLIGSRFKSTICIIDDSTITAECSGSEFSGIGVFQGDYCELSIIHSFISMAVHADMAVCIGGHGSSINVNAQFSRIRLNCEGIDVTGIGEPAGNSRIILKEVKYETRFSAEHIHELDVEDTDSCTIIGGYQQDF